MVDTKKRSGRTRERREMHNLCQPQCTVIMNLHLDGSLNQMFKNENRAIMQISTRTHAETKILHKVVSVVCDASQGTNPLGNAELRQHDSEGEYQQGLMKIWTKVGDFKPT